MKRTSIGITPQFERDMAFCMKELGIKTKAEFIRRAVKEGAALIPNENEKGPPRKRNVRKTK